MRVSLKTRIFTSLASVILLLSVLVALIGYYVVNRDIIERAQSKVRNDLQAARTVYSREISAIQNCLRFYRPGIDPAEIQEISDMDYVFAVAAHDFDGLRSEIAIRAAESGRGVGGSRIMSAVELYERTGERKSLPVSRTRFSHELMEESIEDVMVLEYALPVLDDDGAVIEVVAAGIIVNQNFEMVDRIRALVYGDEEYDGKPVGTVTIFQDGVRISTNVLDAEGERAVGTKVSNDVYDRVVRDGGVWIGRAFVVTHWYKTAYEPILNVDGRVIGMLYVGILEDPFRDLARRIIWMFSAVVATVVLLAMLSSFILASHISKPVASVLQASNRISAGDLGKQVEAHTGIEEFDDLIEGFNQMSTELKNRDERLRVANSKLEESNKNYVELISFVSHELKGILASAIMNVYSVRDGLLGLVNFKQRKAIDSVARNLDYLDATVKKFLNLGRIERDAMKVSKTVVDMNAEIFAQAIDSLVTLAKRKDIAISNELPDELKVEADHDMMKVVANNLLSNAIKYGKDEGSIRISSREGEGMLEVEVYNDSTPIAAEHRDMLFQKFARLDNEQTRLQKGTGLGLYITRRIVEMHGGRIWCEPREAGNSFIFEINKGDQDANTNGNA